MKREHKATKNVLSRRKKFPPLQAALTDKYAVEHAHMLPIFKKTVISPSQPHSKMYGR
jgi:hypothetical protein